MKASKIVHRSEIRIRVDFEYNRGWVSKLRQIADARWSKTMVAWHIPYTSEAFGQLKEVFPEVEITSLPAPVAIATKEVLQVDQMEVLADKGYHTGEQIRQCEQNGITTYVSPKEPASNDPDIFPITSFEYTNKLRCLV